MEEDGGLAGGKLLKYNVQICNNAIVTKVELNLCCFLCTQRRCIAIPEEEHCKQYDQHKHSFLFLNFHTLITLAFITAIFQFTKGSNLSAENTGALMPLKLFHTFNKCIIMLFCYIQNFIIKSLCLIFQHILEVEEKELARELTYTKVCKVMFFLHITLLSGYSSFALQTE